jgi:hypothetical protein
VPAADSIHRTSKPGAGRTRELTTLRYFNRSSPLGRSIAVSRSACPCPSSATPHRRTPPPPLAKAQISFANSSLSGIACLKSRCSVSGNRIGQSLEVGLGQVLKPTADDSFDRRDSQHRRFIPAERYPLTDRRDARWGRDRR